jgi:uncharacterized protein (DUF2147 family)
MKKLIFVFALFSFSALAQTDLTKGLWYNAEKTSKLQFYTQGDKMFGKVVWLSEPIRNGKPRVDDKNPDPKLATKPLMGLIFMKDFKKKSDKLWEDGTIYDPNNGKTYSCKITKVSDNELAVRGFIGISLIGRTSKFTRVD